MTCHFSTKHWFHFFKGRQNLCFQSSKDYRRQARTFWNRLICDPLPPPRPAAAPRSDGEGDTDTHGRRCEFTQEPESPRKQPARPPPGPHVTQDSPDTWREKGRAGAESGRFSPPSGSVTLSAPAQWVPGPLPIWSLLCFLDRSRRFGGRGVFAFLSLPQLPGVWTLKAAFAELVGYWFQL